MNRLIYDDSVTKEDDAKTEIFGYDSNIDQTTLKQEVNLDILNLNEKDLNLVLIDLWRCGRVAFCLPS